MQEQMSQMSKEHRRCSLPNNDNNEVNYIVDQLQEAIICGQLNEIKVLSRTYDLNKYINFSDYAGRTSLHWAIWSQDSKIINFLIENYDLSQSVNLQDVDGNTPLHLAVESGKFKIIKLLSNTYDLSPSINLQDYWGNTPLHYAINNGDIEMVKFLIESNDSSFK